MVGLWLAASCFAPGLAQTNLLTRPWFEARTLHFHTYSCGPTQAVAKLAARLEQFNEAYSVLAGAQAVASPPVVVMAFPDHPSLEPFLPVYDGKPANLAAFFNRGSDENLIALSLSSTDAHSLEAVFHEYTHLLFRHNELFWPLWLKEGMADVYSTFELTGDHSVRIGQPMPLYLALLARQPMMPLHDLLAVTHDSPEYNERERQGVFYAQSWLLTHYLMLGNNPALKARFGQLTTRLRQGEAPEPALTNCFQKSLPAMEAQLRGYLQRGLFEPLTFSVNASLYGPRALSTRGLSRVEVCFRLGDQLLRIGRADAAEAYFQQAHHLAPGSPLGYEGLGLLAAERGDSAEAIGYLQDALQRSSASYLAAYIYAQQRMRLSAGGNRPRLDAETAADIRARLERALTLMPDFGPAHHLLGVLELMQGNNLKSAEEHLQRAILLEPESQSYRLSLAQAQVMKNDPAAARRTLESLQRPYIDARIRTHAQEMLNELGPP